MDNNTTIPDNTAIRTALWRALHLEVDNAPYIIEDTIGLQLIEPQNGWQQQPDMLYTKRLRASIVARARFVDDLVIEYAAKNIHQYIILGAGLDSFAQRKLKDLPHLQVYEMDHPVTQNWKRSKLKEKGFEQNPNLHFVAVDFEKEDWLEKLLTSGFDNTQPTIISCTGVSLYLSQAAILATLKSFTKFAKGSIIACTFYLPIHLLDGEDKPMMEIAIKGAAANDTPMRSFFAANEALNLAQSVHLQAPKTYSTHEMEQLYFQNRKDGLVPATGEYFLLATV